MFMNCPHCRDLVATDPQTRLPPPMCPRCGGVLREPVENEPSAQDPPFTGGLSLASFLRGSEPAASKAADVFPEAQAPAEPVPGPAEALGDPGAINGEDGNGDPVEELLVAAAEEAVEDTADALDNRIEAESPVLPAVAVAEEAALVEAEGEPAAAAIAVPSPAAEPEPGPSFVRQPASVRVDRVTAAWQWIVVALLALLLLLQVLVADRARLAADPGWRPVVSGLCDVLGCAVPAWHQPGAFAMLSRDVRPLAGSPGALQVQATFRNDARWAQAWPVLQLSLSDADGRLLAVRGFTAADYLDPTDKSAGLAPGQSASVALQVLEPSPQVAAFSFEFR